MQKVERKYMLIISACIINSGVLKGLLEFVVKEDYFVYDIDIE